MRKEILASLRILGLILLLGVLAYVVWQPVIPSGLIVRKMAEYVDPGRLDPQGLRVVRFDLSGKGGGRFDIVAGDGRVEVVEDRDGPVDLILFMEATDFNALMFSLARGQTDESAFLRQVLSKKVRFAGDITLLEALFKPPET